MKKFTFALVISFVFTILVNAQIATDFPCYAISKNGNSENIIFGYSPDNADWSPISSTQTNNIVAIAADSNNKVLYAFDNNNSENAGVESSFGIINKETRNFVPIGLPDYGNGDFGEVLLNNITGLAFDNSTNTMYALHNTENSEQQNDLLFIIDVSTGEYVPNAMLDTNGLPADYSSLENVYDSENDVIIYNANDIAINPETGELFVVYSFENSNSLIYVINQQDAKVDRIIYDVYQNNIQSINFTVTANLYETINAIVPNENKLIQIDYYGGNVITIPNVDLDLKCMDCFQNLVNFGTCTGEQLVLENTIVSGLYQSININDDSTIENKVAENSTVVFAAKQAINLQNIDIPASCNLAVEIRPCGL